MGSGVLYLGVRVTLLGSAASSFSIKSCFSKTAPCLRGRGREPSGHRQTAPRGAKTPLSPTSEMESPEGCRASPEPSHHQQGRQWGRGDGGFPCPPPHRKQLFGRGASTDESPQDSQTRTPPCKKQHRAPGTGTDLEGGGDAHTHTESTRLHLEHDLRPLQRRQGSGQSPSEPPDTHILSRLPPRPVPELALPHCRSKSTPNPPPGTVREGAAGPAAPPRPLCCPPQPSPWAPGR